MFEKSEAENMSLKEVTEYMKEYNELHKSEEEKSKEDVSFNEKGVGRGLPMRK